MPRKVKNIAEEEDKWYARWVSTLTRKNVEDLVLRLRKELFYECQEVGLLRGAMQDGLSKSEKHFHNSPLRPTASRTPSDFILKNKKGVYP
jgi:hypothetical protein